MKKDITNNDNYETSVYIICVFFILTNRQTDKISIE